MDIRKIFTYALQREYEGQRFFVASRGDLIASKRAAGRDIDLQDVRLLEAGSADTT